MYQSSYGYKSQIKFNNENEYYKALGYLAKSDGTSSIHWENNQDQGAWGSEGRIHFFINTPPIPGYFKLTAGRLGVAYRTNCNKFIKNIVQNHNFTMENHQDIIAIKDTIPEDYLDDFDMGLTL